MNWHYLPKIGQNGQKLGFWGQNDPKKLECGNFIHWDL
jgi:hypothetical protein